LSHLGAALGLLGPAARGDRGLRRRPEARCEVQASAPQLVGAHPRDLGAACRGVCGKVLQQVGETDGMLAIDAFSCGDRGLRQGRSRHRVG